MARNIHGHQLTSKRRKTGLAEHELHVQVDYIELPKNGMGKTCLASKSGIFRFNFNN